MKVRAAIAGAGLMGRWHAQNLGRAGGEIAAVFDVDSAAAARLAARHKGARACSTVAELFGSAKIDVLHICTPAESHFALATAALENGSHAVIEKPLTPAAPETERLCELAAARRLLICPVHQFAFQRGVAHARRALPSLGRLVQIAATFCSAGAEGKSAAGADSVVADILPHPLSLLEFFAPGALQANGWRTERPVAGELRASQDLADISCSIFISMHARPTVASLVLFGTRGTIHVDLFHGFCVVESGSVSRLRKIVHPFDLAARTLASAAGNLARRGLAGEAAYPGLRELIASFYRAVRGDGSPPIGPDEICRVAWARDEILRGGAVALGDSMR